jgi:hypothetical protein
MVVLFFVVLFVKNFVYFLVLKNNKIPKYIFLIFGFIAVIVSMGLAVFTLNFEDKGIIPMILNIDYFLIVFSFIIKGLSKLLSFVSSVVENKVMNPFNVFFDFNIKLSYFYIIITVIQVLLMLICFVKQV